MTVIMMVVTMTLGMFSVAMLVAVAIVRTVHQDLIEFPPVVPAQASANKRDPDIHGASLRCTIVAPAGKTYDEFFHRRGKIAEKSL